MQVTLGAEVCKVGGALGKARVDGLRGVCMAAGVGSGWQVEDG